MGTSHRPPLHSEETWKSSILEPGAQVLMDFLPTQAQEGASQTALKDRSVWVREEPGYIGIFENETR